jgi:protein transport protein SEC23
MITFSRYITVYEMANSKFIKSVMMDGKEKIAQDDILKMLGIGADKKEETAKYIVNVGQKRENIVEIIESLQPDPWLCLQHGRYERPTFVALQACLAIATAYKSNGGRIVSCLGGPATLGEGTVASMSKEQIIRAHCDLEEETEKAKVYKDACTAYKKITERLIQLNLTLDIFGFSTDQWGLGEMKSMVTSTGGLVFMHEEFNDQLFKDNFKNYFGLNDFSELKVASGGTLTMHVSPPLLIKGALGPLQAIPNKSKQAAKEKIGEGETNQWFLGGLDQNLSYTFILELISGKNVKPADNNAYVQFATKYKHPSGAIFQRVTTMVRSYLDQSTPIQFLGGVDQETVIAVYSKLAARKSFETDSIPVIRWLDRVLISTMKKFSNFRKGDKGSFQICEELYLLPQFFYYLRKSSLVRKFAT